MVQQPKLGLNRSTIRIFLDRPSTRQQHHLLKEDAMKSIRLLSVALIISAFLGMGDTKAEIPSHEVVIEEVEVRISDHGPVVLLTVGRKAIPIYVDPTVAGSIHGALSGQKFPRPLSHDLMHTILMAYGVSVERVFITLKDEIYYGNLTLSFNGQTKQFDSRSSDAIALAIHFKTPIVVGRDLLDSAGKSIDQEGEKVEL